MKKTLAFLAALLAACTVSAAAFTPEGVEGSGEASFGTKDAALSAAPVIATTDPAAAGVPTKSIYGDLLYYTSYEEGAWNSVTFADASIADSITITNEGSGNITVAANPETGADKGNNTSAKAAKIVKTGQFSMITTTFGKSLNKPGVYTLEFDAFYPTTFAASPSLSHTYYANNYNGAHNGVGGQYPADCKGTWVHVVRTSTRTVVTQAEAEAGGVTFTEGVGNKCTPMANIHKFYIFDQSAHSDNSDEKESFYLDNVKLWYDAEPTVIKPGFNLFNGAEKVETFEGTGSVRYAGSHSISLDGNSTGLTRCFDAGNTMAGRTGRMLWWSGKCSTSGQTYPNFTMNSNETYTFNAGREYLLAFDTYIDNAAYTDGAYWLLAPNNGNSVWKTGFNNAIANSKAGNWTSYSESLVPSVDGVLNIKPNTKKNESGVDQYVTMYMDNAMLVPKYKISYITDPAKNEKTDYWWIDVDANGVISDVYTVDNSIKAVAPAVAGKTMMCVGWTDEENGTAPKTTVTLGHKDITLYPIFEEMTAYTGTDGKSYPLYDTAKGALIAVIDFENGSKESSFVNAKYLSRFYPSGGDGYVDDKGIITEEGGNKALWLQGKSSATYHFYRFSLSGLGSFSDKDYADNEGKITAQYDIRFGEDSFNGDTPYMNAYNSRYAYNSWDGTKLTAVDSSISSGLASTAKAALLTWQTAKFSASKYNFTQLHLWYTVNKTAEGVYPTNSMYVDNFVVYYFPVSAFIFNENGNLSFVDTEGESYKMIAAPEGFDSWNDGSGSWFFPGETYTWQELSQKTLSPANFPPIARMDAVKGHLIYFNDYEGGSSTKGTYLDANYFTATPAFSGEFVSKLGVIAENPASSDANASAHAAEFASTNTANKYRFFRFDTGVLQAGKVSASLKMLLDDATAGAYSTVTYRINGNGGFYSDMSKPSTVAANTWNEYSFTGRKVAAAEFNQLNFGPDVNSPFPAGSYFIDDLAIYFFPSDEVFFLDPATGKMTAVKIEGDSYTFPTPASVGITADNFITWVRYDKGANYKAGDSAEASVIGGCTYVAFCQDASKPAMGFAFEMGSSANSVGAGSISPSKITPHYNTVDSNGRVWSRFTNGSKNSSADPRAQLTGLSVDPSEYYIYQSIETSYREGGATQVLHFIPAGGSYSCTADSTHIFSKSIPADTESVIEIDFSKGNYKEHFWGQGANWTLNQLWVQVDQTSLNFDPNTLIWDVDYMRLYRGGYTTVSYYDGDTLLWKDENRGVGTGYLLRGTIPEKAGYVFCGWALEDSHKAVESIDLTGDTSVYALWTKEEDVTATAVSGVEYRDAGALSGVRFKASVTADQYGSPNVLSYGFIVSRAVILAKCGIDGTTVDYNNFTKDTAFSAGQPALYGKTVWVDGVAYDSEEGIDKQYAIADDGTVTFAAVTVGIPSDKYDDVLVARPYITIMVSDDKSITVYGNANSASVNSAKGR